MEQTSGIMEKQTQHAYLKHGHPVGLAATFSIASRDKESGMLGVAVASKVLAVGSTCPFVAPGVGALSSQAYMNPVLGIRGLALLAEGYAAPDVAEMILAEDEGREWRQLNIVDRFGRSIAFTGTRTDPWSGSRSGQDYAIGGNLLAGKEVVEAMEAAFLAEGELDFGDRLLRVLEAADAAGGDMRGKQSAALYVVYRQSIPYINLRVDDHREPISELRRLYDLASNTGVLAYTYRLADTLQPRTIQENAERQRALRLTLGLPLD